MTFRTNTPRPAIAAAALLALAGCHDDAKTPAAQYAEQAVGVQPGSQSKKSVEMKRDLIVEDEKKVIDAKTGQVLSDKKVDTPVTITQEKEVKTDTKVKLGEERPAGK